MRNIDVNPLTLDGPRTWLRWLETPGWLEPGSPARHQVEQALRQDPRCVLTAWRGNEALGVLWGSPTVWGYRLEGLHACDGRVGGALLRDLHARSKGQPLEACLSLDEEAPWLPRLLARAGYVEEYREVRVERSLLEPVPEPRTAFEYRALAELGRERMTELLAELDTGLDAEAEVAEWFSLADPEPEPSLWSLVLLEGQPVGMMLLGKVPGEPHWGTILFMGLLPAFRGRGLGTELHRAALHRLARRGFSHYVDATRADNVPMLRTFATHGCDVLGTWRFSRRRPSRRQ